MSETISLRPTMTEPADLTLHIVQVAARHNKLSSLVGDLAELLVSDLEAAAAAFFWCRQRPHRARGARASLHEVAAAFRPGSTSEEQRRSLKVAAYRAFIARDSVMRPASMGGLGHSVALPLGTATPWAICVVEWASADKRWYAKAALLERVMPSLITATRPARALQEVAQVEHQHTQRRAIFTHTSEAILSVDSEFIIRESNPAFGRILGWHDHQPAGLRCSEVLRCRDDRRMVLCDTARCPLQQAFESDGGATVHDLHWQTYGGTPCEVSASFTAHSMDGGQAIIVARDVTSLNAANRMRSNFISMVSHELRTPLNSINGFLEIVAEGQAGPLNERQTEFLNYARASTQQLATLVEDIVFISKADSGQFTLRLGEVSVSALVRQAAQTTQAQAQKLGVCVTAEIEQDLPPIQADELRLQQVLTNLLGNAVKFSPSGGIVLIETRRDGDMLTLSVSDSGQGISAEDHARVFERFYQAENVTRASTGGYGLGLAIAKLIVEQHGGRIWLESEEGVGATFWFSVPIAGPVSP